LEDVSKKYRVWGFEITGRWNHNEVMPARREACYRLKKVWYTYQKIWEIMWGRHHASIIYLLKTSWKDVK
jgi:hypothetical protein